MSFPVYELFKRQALTLGNLTAEQKKKLMADIKLLDKEGKEMLYSIIRHSSNVDKDESVYSAKYQRKGVVFDLDQFPDDLQKMCFLFVERHIKEMAFSVIAPEIIFE